MKSQQNRQRVKKRREEEYLRIEEIPLLAWGLEAAIQVFITQDKDKANIYNGDCDDYFLSEFNNQFSELEFNNYYNEFVFCFIFQKKNLKFVRLILQIIYLKYHELKTYNKSKVLSIFSFENW